METAGGESKLSIAASHVDTHPSQLGRLLPVNLNYLTHLDTEPTTK